ncbi:hypothetical protein [Paraburkholderia tropica]|uniref:Uncharacterized protein n=1 Tax=Paraburkholderia tropica TaxID=92647 RepID=A0ABX5MB53_9BURK|nr:hypothetical protein [Paraburkholderia tropica]MBB3004194.1 uncharacterized protein YcsI (UPF0317 family) [Paraburkholderia tropica]MBB6323163.1 uncharacterized protein YcsI (UPF0317 family) [Paraburkholderia tropica]MDE1144385.1 hypothetical protein [Paraburkholderia tropica]PXX03332.1 hypothetical protein C7400_15016 [Paraburkholderia tropica]PZW69359.1 hypothetical protein C7399_15016 [Paraburkholderia tropica]
MTDMGDDVDIRTDVPLCRVFRDGAMIAQSHDVSEYWCKALVSFVIDCSFAFDTRGWMRASASAISSL